MLADLVRALAGAAVAVVLPGYFWAVFLRPASGLAARLTYSMALSLASVPVIALGLARSAGTGVTLWIALVSVGLVFVSGAVAVRVWGAAAGTADPVLPRPRPIRDGRALTLIAVALILALVAMRGQKVSLFAATQRSAGSTLVAIVALLAAAGALAAWQAGRAGKAGPAGPLPAKHLPANPGPPQSLPSAPGRQGEEEEEEEGTGGTAAAEDDTASRDAGLGPVGAPPVQQQPGRDPGRSSRFRLPALTLVLGLTAWRAYFGVIRHDWPYVRGSDMFSHAVMAEQMLAHGSYSTYLVYPPGLPTLTAVICRVSGLSPLSLYPVLAPAILLLTTMGAYALAEELWGWEFGVLAAGLSGLVLIGAYGSFAAGRYPDLVAAYFLIVMTVAVLVRFFQSPTVRQGALLAVIGASAVLYHSVATLYLAVLIVIAAVTALPYMVWRHRRSDALALVLAFAGTGLLSACYALVTYGLPKSLGGGSATSTAVSIALGSQPAPAPGLVLNSLSPVILWLGALGAAMLVVGVRYLRNEAQLLAVVTVLLWCAMMYAGSRTSVDGFPKRFERDLGAPLSVVGALGLGVILMSLPRQRDALRSLAGASAVAAAGLASAVLIVQGASDQRASAQRARDVLNRPVAAAGGWLARHNDGSGTIISSPFMNRGGISNRAVLALGGYTGLQSFSPQRIRQPRSLPPAGRRPLLDSHEVLTRPRSCLAARILVRNHVRYVVLFKYDRGSDLAGFAADPAEYRRVFDNKLVTIYQPTRTVCAG